jgi:hypothetical protein
MTQPVNEGSHVSYPSPVSDFHLIQDTSRLDTLMRRHSASKPGPGTLRLGGALANHPRRASWELDLNQHYHACGCDSGANGLLCGLVCGALISVFVLYQGSGLASLLYAPGLAVAGALLGKAAGLIGARVRLARTVREIRTALLTP